MQPGLRTTALEFRGGGHKSYLLGEKRERQKSANTVIIILNLDLKDFFFRYDIPDIPPSKFKVYSIMTLHTDILCNG